MAFVPLIRDHPAKTVLNESVLRGKGAAKRRPDIIWQWGGRTKVTIPFRIGWQPRNPQKGAYFIHCTRLEQSFVEQVFYPVLVPRVVV